MLVYKPLLSLFFRLINFAVLGGIALVIFRRYSLRVIKTLVDDKRKTLSRLTAQKERLTHQVDLLQEQREAQRDIQVTLLHKIKLWNQAAEQQERMRYEEKQRLITHLTHKTREQERQLERALLIKRLAPVVLAQTRYEATSYFKQQAHGQNFVQAIARFMQENT